MDQQIKEIRIKLDGLFKISGTLKRSREVSLAITHFEEAKMSLGKVLGYLGAANPYPESKNPDSKVIERTADTEERGFYFKDPSDHIGNVKSVRKDADAIASEIELIGLPPEAGKSVGVFLTDSFLQTQKGMMWLGMELGRIKAEQDKEALANMPQSPGNPQG